MSRPSNDKHVKRFGFAVLALSTACAYYSLATSVVADPAADASDRPSEAEMQGIVSGMWHDLKPGWDKRLEQDQTQKTCSRYRNDPPGADAKDIQKREAASVVLPADGHVIGDWKRGKEIASSGRGGQFSDPAGIVNGGNCYACHQLEKTEISYGTLGPSLTNYGKDRGFSADAAKATYAKIYDSQATVPCSNMPRFGAHAFLTEDQIKDVVAFLFDKESPVNK